jgi:hypothetical protein
VLPRHKNSKIFENLNVEQSGLKSQNFQKFDSNVRLSCLSAYQHTNSRQIVIKTHFFGIFIGALSLVWYFWPIIKNYQTGLT